MSDECVSTDLDPVTLDSCIGVYVGGTERPVMTCGIPLESINVAKHVVDVELADTLPDETVLRIDGRLVTLAAIRLLLSRL